MTPSPRGAEARRFATLMRTNLAAFVARSFMTVAPGVPFRDNWHIHLLTEYLAAVGRGELRRLVINLPPRSLKSITVSVAWPAWLLGRDPGARVMAASYSMGLALKHAQDCRLILRAPWFRRAFPGVRLAPDQDEKHKVQTTRRGHRIATSVGGTATGEGAGFLIVDDPINPRQAASATSRRAALDWFDQTFSTRLDDKKRGAIVVVMQRLHADDLSGHLLARGGWEHLSLPAVAEAPTQHAMGRVRHARAPGDLLHPGREGAAEIARAKLDLGAGGFAAQYQQAPLPPEGSLIRLHWFARYGAPPADARLVQSWDTAVKAGATTDFWACGTWAVAATGFYLIHVHRARHDYADGKRAAIGLAQRFRPTAILIEDKATGSALIQDLRRETAWPVIAQQPERDKVTRMSITSPTIEAGRVFLPRHADWLPDYERELAAFPGGTHDDQVDMTSQFLNWATRPGAAPRVRAL